MIRGLCVRAALLVIFSAGCSKSEPTYQYVSFNHKPPSDSVQLEPPAGTIPPPRAAVRTLGDSLAAGTAYLLKHQSPDGAWRSDIYATFKDGTALTPLVLCALLDASDTGLNPPGSTEARKKAAAWLAKFVKADGTIDAGPDGFDYPIYTAALAVKALSHPENLDHGKARDAWVNLIKARQLTEKLGWTPADKEYGGWGYCRVIPKRPEPGKFAPPLIESNLSATVFALEALRVARVNDEEVYEAAAVFIRRCQNEDGGFHFIYDDPVRNKAGSPDPPGAKDARFHSYGSTTADGLRAIHLCTNPFDADELFKRHHAAENWLAKNFRADTHPGQYVKAHEPNREAVYYYYAASLSRLFDSVPATLPMVERWGKPLAAELAKRQRDDGSWANPVELVRENDPLVATSLAVSALANCRK